VSNWTLAPLDGGSPHDVAIDTTTEYTVVSVYDAMINRELSPTFDDGTLKYEGTRDKADIVTITETDENGQTWGPCWFTYRAVGEFELNRLRREIPGEAGTVAWYNTLCRELFRVGLVRVRGMWIYARDRNGEVVEANGNPVRILVQLKKHERPGGYDRMTDESFRLFDSPAGDMVRLEIGALIWQASTSSKAHLGNSSPRTSTEPAPSADGQEG
jgi:hypothetical protein